MEIFLQVLFNGVLISPILTALGISTLYAATRIFHLAHGAVIVGAAYAFWWARAVMGWPVFLAVCFSLLIAGAVSHAMNTLVYEKLRKRKARGLGFLIATLALLMLGTGIILAIFGAAPKTIPVQPKNLVLGGVYMTTLQILDIAVVATLAVFFLWMMRYTKLGKAMRATADNAQVAQILGINVKAIRSRAFVSASILGAAAGILLALQYPVDPNAGVLFAVRGFTAAVIGGVGSIAGTILGSLLVGIGEQSVVWFLGPGWRNAVTFVLLFLFLLGRPTGIFGRK
jgi:branched-subunit amino acid ABC-type transport system permease component